MNLLVIRPTFSPALKEAFWGLLELVNLCCQPWLLIGLNNDGFSVCDVINALGDVGVRLLKHIPVC